MEKERINIDDIKPIPKEPNLTKTDWKVYNALKELIVGEEYYKAKTLIVMINNYHQAKIIKPGSDTTLRKIIRRLRRSSLITREIESCREGYRMPLTESNGKSYIANRTLDSIKTCLMSNDLTPEEVYAVVNEYRELRHAQEGQQRLQVGKYTNTEVHRNNKDIYKGEN